MLQLKKSPPPSGGEAEKEKPAAAKPKAPVSEEMIRQAANPNADQAEEEKEDETGEEDEEQMKQSPLLPLYKALDFVKKHTKLIGALVAVLILGAVAAAVTPVILRDLARSDAASAYEDQEYDQVVSLAKGYLNSNPDDSTVKFWLAVALFQTGDREAARAAFAELQNAEYEGDGEFWFYSALSAGDENAGVFSQQMARAQQAFGEERAFIEFALAMSDARAGKAENAVTRFARARLQMKNEDYEVEEDVKYFRALDAYYRARGDYSYNFVLVIRFEDRPVVGISDGSDFTPSMASFMNGYHFSAADSQLFPAEVEPLAIVDLYTASHALRESNLELAQQTLDGAKSADSSPDFASLARPLQAALHVRRGEYSEAAELYRQLAANYPGASSFLVNRANAMWSSGEESAPREEILSLYEEAIEADPEYVQALNNLAVGLFLRNEVARAEPFAKKAYDLESTNFRAVLSYAQVRFALGDYENAEFLASSITEPANRYTSVLRFIAYAIERTGDSKLAIDAYRRWAERHPSESEPYLRIADIYHRDGFPRLMATELAIGWKRYGDFEAGENLANVLLDIDNTGEAQKVLQELKGAKGVRQPFVHIIDGRLAARAEKNARAVAFFQLAINESKDMAETSRVKVVFQAANVMYRLDPEKTAEALAAVPAFENPRYEIMRRAMLALAQKDEDALRDMEVDLADLSPQHGEAIAGYLYDQGFYEMALDLSERVIEKRPNSPEALRVRTLARVELEAAVSAEEEQLQASEAAKLAGAVNELIKAAEASIEGGKYRDALKVLTELLARPDTQAEEARLNLLNKRGHVRLALEEYADAKKDFEEALALKESSSIYAGLGRAQSRLNEYEAAVQSFSTAAGLTRNEDNKREYSMSQARNMSLDGDHDAAEKMLKGIVQANPEEVRPYLELASVYQRSGRTEEAIELLTAAVSVSPKDKNVRRLLARLLTSVGRNDEANRHIRVLQQSL